MIPFLIYPIVILGAGAIYGQNLKNKAVAGLEVSTKIMVTGPMVSVIIPALEEEEYIKDLLISIRNQTYDPIEVIISDSSPLESRMATIEIAQKYEATVVESPFGNVSQARNIGAQNARSEILIFMDADCILANDFIELLVNTLNDGAILAHGVDCWMGKDMMNSVKSCWTFIKPRVHTTGRGIAIRAKDFWAIGGYDQSCNPAETGCREDLRLGTMVEQNFGTGSVVLNYKAVVAESYRRPFHLFERAWVEQGYRQGRIISKL